MSSLEVCPVTLDDVRATTLLTFAGFASNVLTKMLYPNGVTPATMSHFVDQDTKGWHKDPCVRHMQVKDTRTGEIVSYSQWFIYPERSRAELSRPVKLEWPDGCNEETFETLLDNGKRKRDEIMGGRPYIFLAVLVTSPSQQRRGAGQLLLDWGQKQARNFNLPIYLEATPTGRPLYERHGYIAVDHINIDLTSIGISQPATHTCMVCPAPSPQSPARNPPRTYTIAPITSELDFLRLAHIERVSYKEDLTISLCFPGQQTVHDSAKNQATTFRTDPSAHYVKATDTSTNSIVAWARWNFYVDVVPAERTAGTKEWGEGTNAPLCEYFFSAMDAKREMHMKDRPFFLMGILVTMPEYQGKGIGSSLLQWGLEIADEKGVECYINASPKAVKMYERLGWVEVDHVDVDLGQYGGEEGKIDRTVCLIRKPGGGEWKTEGGTYFGNRAASP